MEQQFLKELITDGFAGKNQAIHAYDRMIWTVRSGFLALVFAAWGLLVKAAVEHNIKWEGLWQYSILLSFMTLVLALGGYVIDVNYIKRKFRVITTVNELREIVIRPGELQYSAEAISRISELLKISGDSINIEYRSPQYDNECRVSRIIYGFPSLLVIINILTYLS